jgi:predicted RNA-binding Zn ribbon-like protein
VDGLLNGHQVSRRAARLTRLARPSVATVRLDVGDDQILRARLKWSEPTPAATLARRLALELAEIDVARLKRCERAACNLVFYDTTRSGTRRWHAESPCGNRERQQRYRAARLGSANKVAGSTATGSCG